MKNVRVLLVVVGTLILQLPLLATANAQSGSSNVEVEGTFISCEQMAPDMLATAQSAGACLPGTMSPMNTVRGDCGSSTLEFFNGYNGTLTVFVASTSVTYPIYEVYFDVSWTNYATGAEGNFGDSSRDVKTPTTWSKYYYGIPTGRGSVGGIASGVTFTAGGACVWLGPASNANVT